jgi:predicted nuclease of predicted toxin-antitoxin system
LRFLLDENFPLQLQRRLTAAGLEAEHIITMGRRGMPDSEILARLAVARSG